jgi:hypothetical protein
MSFKDFVNSKKKFDVLKELEIFGKSLAYKANPDNYSEQEKKKSKHYIPEVEATRKVYVKIKSGGDAIALLTELNYFVKEKELDILVEKIRNCK